MQVWAVTYIPELLSEDLYQQGLLLVDPESQARIKRFYRREDATRTLIGQLLVRMMLKERSISSTTFGKTDAGKPYIQSPDMKDPVGFNITHDNSLIAMAFAPGIYNPPAFSIGVDVMKVKIPGRETFASFVKTVGDQLTPHEHDLLSGVPLEEGLRRFFWMWTLKEAYTKALGLGLGFDFARVEFDVKTRKVRIDGEMPVGWRFSMFVINVGEDLYEGVVAEYLGGSDNEVMTEFQEHGWLKRYDAASFVKKAIDELAD